MLVSFVSSTFMVSHGARSSGSGGIDAKQRWKSSASFANGHLSNSRHACSSTYRKEKSSAKDITTQAKLLTLADYVVPGPAQINPHADEANQLTKDLCRHHDILLPHFDSYNTMSAYLYPRAPLDRLVCINFFMTFLFYVDDYYEQMEDDHEFGKAFQSVLETVQKIVFEGHDPAEHHVLCSASHEVRSQLQRFSTPEWMSRFRPCCARHFTFLESIQEVSYSEVQSINDYVTSRLWDSGCEPMIKLIELALGVYLPDDVLLHEHIQKLEELSMRISWMSNDIFSYEKEVMRLGTNYNYLNLLMKNKHVSFEAAVHEAISEVNKDTLTFLELEADLPTWDDREIDQNVKLYVRGLRDVIIASYHWQLSTNRYRSPNHPLPELQVEV